MASKDGAVAWIVVLVLTFAVRVAVRSPARRSGARVATPRRRSPTFVVWAFAEERGQVREIEFGAHAYRVEIPKELRETTMFRVVGRPLAVGSAPTPALAVVHPAPPAEWPTAIWLAESQLARGAAVEVGTPDGVVLVRVVPGTAPGALVPIPAPGRPGASSGRSVRVRAFRAEMRASPRSLGLEHDAIVAGARARVETLRQRLPDAFRAHPPLSATTIARAAARGGWFGVFRLVHERLGLAAYCVLPRVVDGLPEHVLGQCRRDARPGGNPTLGVIELSRQATADPFVLAATVAHELCHVLYGSWVETEDQRVARRRQARARARREDPRVDYDEEYDVELLVCELGLGTAAVAAWRNGLGRPGYFPFEVYERLVADAAERSRAHEA